MALKSVSKIPTIRIEIGNYIKRIPDKYKADNLSVLFHSWSGVNYGLGDFRTYLKPSQAKFVTNYFRDTKNKGFGAFFSDAAKVFATSRGVSPSLLKTKADILAADKVLKDVTDTLLKASRGTDSERRVNNVVSGIYTSWFSFVRRFSRFAE